MFIHSSQLFPNKKFFVSITFYFLQQQLLNYSESFQFLHKIYLRLKICGSLIIIILIKMLSHTIRIIVTVQVATRKEKEIKCRSIIAYKCTIERK